MRARAVAFLGVVALGLAGAPTASAAAGIPAKPAAAVQTQQVFDIALDEAHGFLYASTPAGIVVFSLPSLTNVATIDVGANGRGLDLTSDGRTLAVARFDDIALVDTASRTIAGTLIPSSGQLVKVRFGRADRLYAVAESGPLHVFDVPGRTEVGSIAATQVTSLALTADGSSLYETDFVGSGVMSVFRYDVRTDTPVLSGATPSESTFPDQVALRPDGSRVYVSNGEVWSGDLTTLLGTVPGIVGRSTHRVAYAAGGDVLVITDHPQGTPPFMLRVNGTTLAVTATRHTQHVVPLAVNDAGTVAYAATASALMHDLEAIDFTAPDSPTVAARAGIGSAVVSWTPPADAGGSPITGYVVLSSEGDRLTVDGGVTSVLLTGLPAVPREFSVAAVNASGSGPLAPPPFRVRPEPGGTFHTLTPTRILDTRIGLGAPMGRIGPGGSLTVQVAGLGGVPAADVSAVVMNVTAVDTTSSSFLTVYPAGSTRPLASNLNWAPGQTVPNLVTVALGANGGVTIFNDHGLTDVLLDVAGWVGDSFNSTGPEGMFNALPPTRLHDTRTPYGPIGPGETLALQVIGIGGGLPPSGVSAVVLNVTVTQPTLPSFITVWPAGEARPTTSNLNFQPGQTRANRVMVKVGAAGMVNIFNAQGTAHVVVDASGWYTDATSTAGGSGLVADNPPSRLFDTRDPGHGRLLPGNILRIPSTQFPAPTALILNVTAVGASAPTFLTLFPAGRQPPPSSDLNLLPGETVPNLTVVKLDSTFDAFDTLDDPNGGAVDAVFDLYGFYGGVVQPLTAQVVARAGPR